MAAIVAIVVAVRFLRRAENRQRLVAGMEKRPALRPLLVIGRRLAPQARFVAGRLTPGGLGLEFTTLLAVLAVALGVYYAVAEHLWNSSLWWDVAWITLVLFPAVFGLVWLALPLWRCGARSP